jgi:subtilisin family serine protease
VALAARKVKRERRHDRKKADRKQDRKQKDRKQDRKKNDRKKKDRKSHGRKGHTGRAVELTTGILPGADTVDPEPDKGPISAEGRYIVLLKSGSGDELQAANDIAAAVGGVIPTHVYRYVFPGFAAVIPADKLDDVRNDPRVQAVAADRVVHLEAQTIPTGISRIDATNNPTADIDGSGPPVDVDVAIIDSAGNDSHEDLDIHAWANCTPSHTNSDDHGHGTHVGGTVGAIDNDFGVVGVAPGARLWNIRVLVHGSGFDSWIICGLDLVRQYATPQTDGLGDIEVANVSIGGTGADSDCATNLTDLSHQAYCRVVTAGVTVAVAAGNETQNAANHVPAAYDEVITVSALADSNGQPGPVLGPATSWGPDESLAGFSNFGADVDLAAPGVDILSTVPKGACELCDPSGYRKLNGTSMASPHVAGAAALYIATHAGAPPTEVKAAILSAKENVVMANDPDAFDEGVLDVGGSFGTSSASAESRPASATNSDDLKASAKKEDKKVKKSQQKQGNKARKSTKKKH